MGERLAGQRFSDFPPWRPPKEYFDHDECFSTNGSIYGSTAAGAGAGVTFGQIAEDGRPGIAVVSTGTTATGRAAYVIDGANLNDLFPPTVAQKFVLEQTIQLVDLSAVAEEFSNKHGFLNALAAVDATDGAYFLYDRLTNVNWLCKTANSGVRTTVDTGIAVAEDVWIKLRVELSLFVASFFFNDRLVASISTNLPVGATDVFGAGAAMLKSAGVTARTIRLDHLDFRITGLNR